LKPRLSRPTKLLLLIALILALFVPSLYLFGLLPLEEDTYQIALVGPMSGAKASNGESMRQGVELLLDKINQAGGINGKEVELLVFDDQGDPDYAPEVAAQIALESQALVVLGHLNGAEAVRGGKVYQEYGLPAISASATLDEVTLGNDWYFRVIFNNHSQGVFLANYLIKVLGHETASIIYNTNQKNSTELVEPFANTFQGLGGEIKYQWAFEQPSEQDITDQLDEIIIELLKARDDDPGIIFLAVNEQEGLELLTQMKRKGLGYPLVGAVLLGEGQFNNQFRDLPEEQIDPGYFTDGLLALSPFLFDIGGEQAEEFNTLFDQRYGKNPDWVAATYYDAALTALDALRAADIQGDPHNLTTDRVNIRHHLETLNMPENALDGITGKIYFNKNGDIEKTIPMGLFHNGYLISAMNQLQPIYAPRQITDLSDRLADGRVLIVNNRYMHNTAIAYTSVAFNEISDIDLKDATFTADFYVWFRSAGEINADYIQFNNSEIDYRLKDQDVFVEEVVDGITYRIYRVKTTFNSEFHYRDYPFDRQKIAIRFQHEDLTREDLIYVIDWVGMATEANHEIFDKLRQDEVFDAEGEWQPTAIHFYQDTLANAGSLGHPRFLDSDTGLEYSQFNANIEIERDVLSFIFKNMLPLGAVIILSYISIFLPPEQLAIKNAIGRGALLTVAFFHIKLSNDLPGIGYTVALDNVFYVMYGMIVAEIILTMITRWENDRGNTNRVSTYMLAGKIIYPLIVLSLGFWFFSHFSTFSWSPVQQPAQPIETGIVRDDTDRDEPESGPVTLTLGSWRVDDIDPLNRILAVFNQQHPDIEVKFDPLLNYFNSLDAQLDSGGGPDLYYVGAFSYADGYIENDHLEPLTDLSGLHENFSHEALQAWVDDEQVPYAVPVMASYMGIYYNQDIFAELGLDLPTTWEELLVAAEAIQAAGHIPFANTSGSQWTARALLFWNIVPNLIGGAEGREAYMSGARCFNDAHVVAAYQALADLVPYLPAGHEELRDSDSEDLFLQGEAAMWMNGSWDLLNLQQANPDFKWSVIAVPPPAGQTGYVIYAPDFGIGLNTVSKNKAAARVFLEWLTTPEAAELFGNQLLGFFSMNTAAPHLEDAHAQAFQALASDQDTDVSWAINEGLPSGSKLMEIGALGVLHGEMTPQEAADQLQKGLAAWYEPAQICER